MRSKKADSPTASREGAEGTGRCQGLHYLMWSYRGEGHTIVGEVIG